MIINEIRELVYLLLIDFTEFRVVAFFALLEIF